MFGSAYRERLLCLLILLLGDIQPVYEALQLPPEGLHLGVDPIQQLVLSDPGEHKSGFSTTKQRFKFSASKKGLELGLKFPDGNLFLLSSLPATLLVLIQPGEQLPAVDVDSGLGDDSAGVSDEPIDGPTQPLRLDADVYHLLPVLQASG